MGNIFGEKKPLKELIREKQRMIKRSCRELDKSIRDLENKEKIKIADMKKAIDQDHIDIGRNRAKDISRIRSALKKYIMMKSHLDAIALRMTTVKTQQDLGDAMKGVTQALKSINAEISVPELNKIMREFMTEDMKAEEMNEVMNDTLDDALEGDVEEEDELVNSIMMEVKMKKEDALNSTPSGGVPTAEATPTAPAVGAGDDGLNELQQRLNNLRRDA